MKYTRVRETLTAGRAISRTGRVAADARATTFPSRSMIDTSYLGTGFMSNTPVTRTAKRGCVASVGLGVDVVADEGAAVAAAGLGDDALAGVGVVGAAGAGAHAASIARTSAPTRRRMNETLQTTPQADGTIPANRST
jgi:hypothetical protein